MRIISGYLGGRKFYPPGNLPTRPTTDISKTALFNILYHNYDLQDSMALDLFAGTGNISYEFISRGAAHVTAVDKDRKCILFMQKMKLEWKLENLEIIQSEVFKFISFCSQKFDFIFAGPPYPLETIDALPEKIFDAQLLNPCGVFILETSPAHHFKEHAFFKEERHYGQTHFHFFLQPETALS